MRLLVLSFLFLAGCSAQLTRAPSSENLPWGLTSSGFPEGRAVLRWSDPHYEDTHAPKLDDLTHVEVPVTCADKHLYPTHPQQISKTYHLFRNAVYDANAVTATSRVCKTAGGKGCALTDVYQYAVMSDLYADACGGLYRGIWSAGFLKQDDTKDALGSKGRKLNPVSGSLFAGDREDGPTRAVEAKEFLFLTTPFPGDVDAAAHLAKEASATHTFDGATHLFSKRK